MNHHHLLSLNVHASTSSSINLLSLFDQKSPLEEERFIMMPPKDSPPTTKRLFATLEHDEDKKKIKKMLMPKKISQREDEKTKKKRTMPKKQVGRWPVVEGDATEQLKRFITGEMYGLDMKLVIQKMLYESDVKTSQCRLNMPIKQLEMHPDRFLTADEKRVTEDESEEGVEVRVVGPNLQMYKEPLLLKRWHMQNTDNYVLKKNWNKFAAKNSYEGGLKKDTMIQVWSFRKNRQLCFAIVPVERPYMML